MGKEKLLELWWQLYRTSLPERNVRNVTPMDFFRLSVHTSLGHLLGDKSNAEIKDTFHFRDLSRKLRKFIAAFDLCQRTKHMNRAYDVAERHQLPQRPGELCAVDLNGNFPTSRSNVRYIFVRYDMFSKHVKLYPLKLATTKPDLNRLLNHYFVNVIKIKVVLSDTAVN